jgi:UDP-N-acetylmuramoylalanine--D-glutamate ligase
MNKEILELLKGRKIIILGFGKEGISTYQFIRKHFPDMSLTVADKNQSLQFDDMKNDPHLTCVSGEHYIDNLNEYDLIFKSPGVNLSKIHYWIPSEKITSQTDLFLKFYHHQVIGITGTKGKSTTASLIYHILKESGSPTILAGNIGTPFFDIMEQIVQETTVVAELSAHQLEYISRSPHIAVLLNIFQEHLDHFISFNDYQIAKLNITNYQSEQDILIYNHDDLHIPEWITQAKYQRQFLPFSNKVSLTTGACLTENVIRLMQRGEVMASFEMNGLDNLPGQHNYYNVMAAILAVLQKGIPTNKIFPALQNYKPLEHRIEFFGTYQGIHFYNDSISTIPEATIAAIHAIKKVDTLILGGFDRGIAYHELIVFLAHSLVQNVIFTGPAGKRILQEWKLSGEPLPQHYMESNDFTEIVNVVFNVTRQGKACLLSPAASSYDQFKNFEERGTIFKNLVQKQAES